LNVVLLVHCEPYAKELGLHIGGFEKNYILIFLFFLYCYHVGIAETFQEGKKAKSYDHGSPLL
jgi:hypothetical protein